MAEGSLLLGVLAAAWLGFALLALSQARHWLRVAGTAPPSPARVLVLRWAGGASIVLSLVLALLRDGAGFGSLLWATAISLAALAVAFTLAWRPGVLRPLAVAGRGCVASRTARTSQ